MHISSLHPPKRLGPDSRLEWIQRGGGHQLIARMLDSVA